MAGHVGLRGVRANEPCEPVGLARRWRPGGAAAARDDGSGAATALLRLLDRPLYWTAGTAADAAPAVPPVRPSSRLAERHAEAVILSIRPSGRPAEWPGGRGLPPRLPDRRQAGHRPAAAPSLIQRAGHLPSALGTACAAQGPRWSSYPSSGHGARGAVPRWSMCLPYGQSLAALRSLRGGSRSLAAQGGRLVTM